GRQAMPPDTTELETVMIIYQDRIRRFEGVLAEEPRREILEHIHRDSDGTIAHGNHPQIGAMGNERSQEGGRRRHATRWRLTEGGEGACKATPAIHGHQELFNANPRQMGLDDTAE